MRQIVLLAHDIRSTHNVGALLRTAECLGVEHVYFTGYTPYPTAQDDERLPHIAAKLSAQIHKTALGAEDLVGWSHADDVNGLIATLKNDDFTLAALEQSEKSIVLASYKPAEKIALLIGREVEGIDPSLLQLADVTLEIPQFGKKESLNVVQATAIALYELGKS